MGIFLKVWCCKVLWTVIYSSVLSNLSCHQTRLLHLIWVLFPLHHKWVGRWVRFHVHPSAVDPIAKRVNCLLSKFVLVSQIVVRWLDFGLLLKKSNLLRDQLAYASSFSSDFFKFVILYELTYLMNLALSSFLPAALHPLVNCWGGHSLVVYSRLWISLLNELRSPLSVDSVHLHGEPVCWLQRCFIFGLGLFSERRKSWLVRSCFLASVDPSLAWDRLRLRHLTSVCCRAAPVLILSHA